jgi:hypothetical protein
VFRERPVPVELPFVIFMVKILPVWAIECGEIEAHYVRSDEARSEILLPGEAPGKHLGFLPTQNGHTVPRFLAVADGVVTEFFKNRMGKFLVCELEFLESHYVGLSFREPSCNKVESSTQSIDIPGCHFHRFTPCMGSIPDRIAGFGFGPGRPLCVELVEERISLDKFSELDSGEDIPIETEKVRSCLVEAPKFLSPGAGFVLFNAAPSGDKAPNGC